MTVLCWWIEISGDGERTIERERERGGETVRRAREREGGRGELLLPNYSDWAGFAGSSQIGHGSQIQAVPTWPPSNKEPLTAKSGESKHQKETTKNFVSFFLACVHTKAPSPLPSSLPTTTTTSTPVCRIIWTIHFFAGGVTFPGRRKKAGAPPPLLQQLLLPPPPLPSTLLSHLCCSFFAFLFFQLPFTVARRWSQSLGLCCCSVCLSQSLRTQLDALRERGAALHYSIWKLWAVRQRQAVARCVQDREPCFSTGSPGITSKESWRKWREGRKRSRDWRRACSSTGESR